MVRPRLRLLLLLLSYLSPSSAGKQGGAQGDAALRLVFPAPPPPPEECVLSTDRAGPPRDGEGSGPPRESGARAPACGSAPATGKRRGRPLGSGKRKAQGYAEARDAGAGAGAGGAGGAGGAFGGWKRVRA